MAKHVRWTDENPDRRGSSYTQLIQELERNIGHLQETWRVCRAEKEELLDILSGIFTDGYTDIHYESVKKIIDKYAK